jgi:hypothetical protein
MNGEVFKIADAAAFVAAIDRELAGCTRDHVDMVRKGRLTQAESDYVVGLLRDIRADLIHAFGPLEPGASIEQPGPAVRWRAKVRWINGELERRQSAYPELVVKGRLTDQDAKIGLRLMSTLRRLYWRELFMWEPDPGPALDFLLAIRSRKVASNEDLDRLIPHGRETYRELARKHFAAIELEDAAAQGELVAA